MIRQIFFKMSTTSKAIILDYNDLKKGDRFFYDEIQQAYGSKGHGVLMVKNIPNFIEIREKLLPLSHRLANLKQDVLKKYTRQDIYHSLGWSCGVEQFYGKYDVSKGSFYSRAAADFPLQLTKEERKQFTQMELAMRKPNIWVEEIPEIQKYTKQMSKLMIGTGALVAKQIDAYVNKVLQSAMKIQLQKMVMSRINHVGRLLHYFPFNVQQNVKDDWCGWHNDHGALTALTSSMYIDKNGNQVNFKETKGGLFAKNRVSDIAKISIPKDMLAFQLGQSAQILTGGVLQATPHCVIRSQQLAGKNISRNTFALFMQPDQLQKMQVPYGINPQNASNKSAHHIPPLQKRWDNGIYFKQFHSRTLKEYS